MYALTREDNLLQDGGFPWLFLWQSTASDLQSNAPKPSPSKPPPTITLKQGDLLPGLGHQANAALQNQNVLLRTGHPAWFCTANNWPVSPLRQAWGLRQTLLHRSRYASAGTSSRSVNRS